MTDTDRIPEGLQDAELSAPTRGFIADGWYYEEDFGSARLGIRIRETLHEEVSAYQRIEVHDSTFFGRILTLDGVMMFTERDEFVYHELLTHVPLVSLPEPRSVLIIGGGDCGCLREVLLHPTVERVVQCDIDERVMRVCERFFPWVGEAAADRRVELVFDDGAGFVEANPASFDLIIVDSTDPVGPGVGLFLPGFYAKVASALRPGGVMTAQTQTPHWDARTVGVIYEQIGAAFERVSTYLGWIPVYPSGCWSLAYASAGRSHDDHFDAERAAAITAGARYYNAEIHRAAFALPNFARAAVAGRNSFERFDRANFAEVGAR